VLNIICENRVLGITGSDSQQIVNSSNGLIASRAFLHESRSYAMRTIVASLFALLLFSSGSARADLIFQFWHDNNGLSNYDPGTSYLFQT
jgi:hypothetical protein